MPLIRTDICELILEDCKKVYQKLGFDDKDIHILDETIENNQY